jgi:hypothetical protein
MKQIQLNQTGWLITGEAEIYLWGGGTCNIEMDKKKIDGELTRKKLLSCVNDGRFGCEAILGAEIHVYELYEGGYTEYRTTIIADKRYRKQFNQKL